MLNFALVHDMASAAAVYGASIATFTRMEEGQRVWFQLAVVRGDLVGRQFSVAPATLRWFNTHPQGMGERE